MASKDYISIIRLFQYCEIPLGNSFDLSRTKKQLQAEFGMSRTGFIEIDGYTYTRHDVFEEIERPDFPQRLEFHQQIWNAPPLLNLLEDNEVHFATIDDGFRPFWHNQKFDAFISPYFARPFNHVSRNLLAEKRLEEMGRFLGFEDFLQGNDREEAFRPLRIFLEENSRLLRNTREENYTLMRPKLIHWIETEWYILFNNLPHEFYDEKVEMTTQLINLGVAIQKKYRKDCRKMSVQLMGVRDIPNHLSEIILNNDTAYHTRKPSGFSKHFWGAWLVFFIVKGLANSCNEGKKNYDYFKSGDYRIYQNDSTINIIKQKLEKIKQDSTKGTNVKDSFK